MTWICCCMAIDTSFAFLDCRIFVFECKNRCITFGFNQAAITLTNHMLERLLKTTLMHHHVLKSEIRKEQREPPTAEAMIEYQAEGKQRYLANNLEKNINAACTEGLISKKEKQELHELRERFRNAFGHADPDKTFGKSEVPVQAVRLGESAGGIEVGPEESVRVADFLLAMGPLQVKLAEDFAPGYFRYVDDLARRIFEKVYPKTMGGEEGSVEDAPDPHHVS